MCQFALFLFLLSLVETHIELLAHRAQHRLEVLSHYYYIGRRLTSRLSQITEGLFPLLVLLQSGGNFQGQWAMPICVMDGWGKETFKDNGQC